MWYRCKIMCMISLCDAAGIYFWVCLCWNYVLTSWIFCRLYVGGTFIPKASIIRLGWLILILKVVLLSFYLYGKLVVTRVILITITMSHRQVSNRMFLVMSTIHVKNVEKWQKKVLMSFHQKEPERGNCMQVVCD